MPNVHPLVIDHTDNSHQVYDDVLSCHMLWLQTLKESEQLCWLEKGKLREWWVGEKWNEIKKSLW